MLLIADFYRSTGLDHITVIELFRTGRLGGALVSPDDPTRPIGIFDDELPSREALAVMGLPVRDDYDPGALRSYGQTDDDSDDQA